MTILKPKLSKGPILVKGGKIMAPSASQGQLPIIPKSSRLWWLRLLRT